MRKSQSLQSAVWVVMGPSVPAVLPTMIVVHLSISANDISDASMTAKIDSARLRTDVNILGRWQVRLGQTFFIWFDDELWSVVRKIVNGMALCNRFDGMVSVEMQMSTHRLTKYTQRWKTRLKNTTNAQINFVAVQFFCKNKSVFT